MNTPNWLFEHLQAKERRIAAAKAKLWAQDLNRASVPAWSADWLSCALYGLLVVILGVLLTLAYLR